MKKIIGLSALLMAWLCFSGCSDDSPCKDGAERCVSKDKPNLIERCDDGKWEQFDLSDIRDHEAEVCVVINDEVERRSVCPGDAEGDYVTILPWHNPTCAEVKCVKDDRGVLYTGESNVCPQSGGYIEDDHCVCD